MEIVAEIGSNHGGMLSHALELIKEAAQAGATVVKFQVFRVEKLDSRPQIREQLRLYELPLEWLPVLRACAHQQKLKFSVTPFDIETCQSLRGLVDMVKISAYDLPYEDLVREAAKLGVSLVLSAAMATPQEIENAISWVCGEGLDIENITLLYGTAMYPAKQKDARLARLLWHRQYYPYIPYGISDHTLGIMIPVYAALLGSYMIEKHFMLGQDSPDACVSLQPQEFSAMTQLLFTIPGILGAVQPKGPLPCEMPLYTTCRRSNSKPLRG